MQQDSPNYDHETRWDALIECYCEGCEDEMLVTETEYESDDTILLLCNFCKGEDLESVEEEESRFWNVEDMPVDVSNINITGVNNNA